MLPNEVPASALCFAADLEIGEPAAGVDANVPITIRARSGEAVETCCFGRAVHDMSGMTPEKPSIPLDYIHDWNQVIGFADKFDPADDGLMVVGQLVPLEPTDRASEIIRKKRRGVPYQASINFAPYGMVIEQVGEGAAVQVNGYEFTGPGIIFRKWILRGVAICPYGTDGDTDLQLSQKPKVPITFLTQGNIMATETKPAKTPEEIAAETAAAKKAADEAAGKKVADAAAKTPEELAAEAAAKKTADEAAAAAAAAAGGTQLTAGPGQRFLDAFGDVGGTWFAQGKSFEEASTLFAAATRKRLDDLEKENGTLKTQLTAARAAGGEKDPLSFNGEMTPEQRQAHELAAKGVTDNYAKLAASIKLPGKKK